MERHLEVIKHIIKLLETLSEGLEYVQIRLDEGSMHATMQVLEDCMEAFAAIERSLNPLLAELPQNQIEFHSETLFKSMDYLVFYYEQSNVGHACHILREETFPAFQTWKQEIESDLYPFILC